MPKQRCAPVGFFGKPEVLGKDKRSCKINSIPTGRDARPASMACRTLTGGVRGSILQLWTMPTDNLSGTCKRGCKHLVATQPPSGQPP